MIIKILGRDGCPNCRRLEENMKQAVKELGIKATIEKVNNINDVINYGVIKLPALVVDEQVKLTGQIPSIEELKKYL